MSGTKKTIVFSHIEKCAGTSLTSYFRSALPFASCDILSKNNVVSLKELKTAKALYPSCRFIAGHSLSPKIYQDIESVFGETVTFTIVREPIERIISNYVFDKARGVWDKGLSEYSEIDWKRNYLSRYIGSGAVEDRDNELKKIDFVFTVDQMKNTIPHLFKFAGLNLKYENKKINTVASSWGGAPAEVSLKDGIKVGNYCISKSEYEMLVLHNKIDIQFYNMVASNPIIPSMDLDVNLDLTSCQTKVGGFYDKFSLLYRNLVYKPIVIKKIGKHALPRNFVNPADVEAGNAFK